jgi:hypothetical protein
MNLERRAMAHTEKLKPHEGMLQSKYGSMSEPMVDQLKEINNIILDFILNSEKFQSYLSSIFETLGKYAGKQRHGQYLFTVERVSHLNVTQNQYHLEKKCESTGILVILCRTLMRL